MIIRKLKDLIPKPLGDLYNEYKWFVIDNYEVLSGKRDQLQPPARLIFVGDGDFSLIGKTFLDYFINLCDLKPYERILDVGCGIGRIAIPLTRYLDQHGSYDGIDIVDNGIDWCTKNIHKRYPKFRFHHADIFNKFFNPNGKSSASDFRFPFESETFNFVFLTSVFTHMLQADFENYSREIARVLKDDGRCFLTFFLLNKESLSLNKNPRLSFTRLDENISIQNNEFPEAAVAYREEYVRNMLEEAGLRITEPIHYGNWCGREEFLSYQDIIIARRK